MRLHTHLRVIVNPVFRSADTRMEEQSCFNGFTRASKATNMAPVNSSTACWSSPSPLAAPGTGPNRWIQTVKPSVQARDGPGRKQGGFTATRAALLLLALHHGWCRCALSFLWLAANSRAVKCCASCKCHAFKQTGFRTAGFLDCITASLLNFSLFFRGRGGGRK